MRRESLESAEAQWRQLVRVGCNSEPLEMVNNRRTLKWRFGVPAPRVFLIAPTDTAQYRSADCEAACGASPAALTSPRADRKVARSGTFSGQFEHLYTV